MKESGVHQNIAFPADDQSPKVSEPSKSSLYLPSPPIPAQRSSILGLRPLSSCSMRRDQLNSFPLQSVTQGIAVIGFVRNQPLRTLFRTPHPRSGNRDRLQCFLDQSYFRWRGRVKGASQRNTLAVDHHHPLRSFAPLRFSDCEPPFLAGAKLPSTKASSQSKTSC